MRLVTACLVVSVVNFIPMNASASEMKTEAEVTFQGAGRIPVDESETNQNNYVNVPRNNNTEDKKFSVSTGSVYDNLSGKEVMNTPLLLPNTGRNKVKSLNNVTYSLLIALAIIVQKRKRKNT